MRKHQTQYQISEPFGSLPAPGELVEEIQTAPYYRIDENARSASSGGQFSLTLEGRGVFQIGDESVELKPGVGFLALHGEKDVSYYYPEDGVVPWVFLWISFTGGASERIIREINEKRGCVFNLDVNCELVVELRGLVRRPGVVSPMTPGQGAEMCSRIFGALIDSRSPKQEGGADGDLTIRFLEYVLENIRRDFGVSEAAEALSVSREHLTRVVSRETGVPPATHIRDRRMREARHLLMETNLACSDIAEELGFTSPASFSRTFKAVTGTTPERYRMKS